MVDGVERWLVNVLRIPPEPRPPAGDPAASRVFRAAPNYYRLRLLAWTAKQAAALVGLVVTLAFLHADPADRLFSRLPSGRTLETVVQGLEVLGFLGFLLQVPLTYAATRLDYEWRWYLVSDRSLRIRAGIWTVEELTMTFANIQELTVHQGPLQRLLGIADLKVRSAGGGGAVAEGGNQRETHVAYFHGVENAESIRDVILEHLRRLRDAGLGDSDDSSGERRPRVDDELLEAARDLLAEARALRRTPIP